MHDMLQKAKRVLNAVEQFAKERIWKRVVAQESVRDLLLRTAQDPKLKGAIDNLYRPGAKVGSGSTMDAYRFEQETGQLLSPKGHAQKLLDRKAQLQRMLNPDLSVNDRGIVERLLIDIEDALNGR